MMRSNRKLPAPSRMRQSRHAVAFPPVLLLSILSVFLTPAGVGAQEPGPGESGASGTNAENEKKELIRSARDDWRETLRYGIDSEVLDLLKTLKDQNEKSLNGEIQTLLQTSFNTKVREAALAQLEAGSDGRAEDDAIRILENFEDEEGALVSAAIRYLAVIESAKSAPAIAKVLDSAQESLAAAAVKALGRVGGPDQQELLLARYDEEDTPLGMRGEIILALGELKAKSATDKLIGILEDREEEGVLRRYACHALGKIGDPAAIEPLRRAYGESDTLLRSYAVAALASFPGRDDVREILTAALRDSFWRVRVSAIQGLAEMNDREAVDILLYKAKKDPEPNVREEALRAVGKIGTGEALDFLRGIYRDVVANIRYRETALRTLVEHDLGGSLPTFRDVVAAEWDKKDSRILDLTCRVLAEQEAGSLGSFYEKLLEHPNFIIRMYGIRGIARNDLSQYRSRVEELSKEGNPQPVRKLALSALETL